MTMIKSFILCLTIASILALSGCQSIPMPKIVIPTTTPSPQPPGIDDATLLSIALADISENQAQYNGSATSPLTDRYLIEELNKLLLKRVYKEAFNSKIEVINAVWLIPNNNPDTEDLLLIIDCNGHQDDCNIQKAVSETIFLLQWLPVGRGSSVHPESTTSDGRFWAFPTKTRNVFFYICNTKNRRGFAKVTGNNMNDYINGLLPGESIATLIHVEDLP